jgi:thiamine-monophosphate kinase
VEGEQAALDWLRLTLPGPPPGETWLGDDAAVVACAAPNSLAPTILLAADLVVAGVHADLDLVSLSDLGWKAVAVNVSDMAAMGGRPSHLLVSVAGPADTELGELYEGIGAAAAEYGCPVVGGDLSSSPHLVVSVAVTGWASRPVLRSGARAGDQLWLTGPVGASAAGLRLLRAGADGSDPEVAPLLAAHRRPRARVAEGAVAAGLGATAMIDISDGLALDAWRLGAASNVGIDLSRVPLAPGASLEEGLGGGEDYQLLFAVGPEHDVLEAFAACGLAEPARIGACAGARGALDVMGRPYQPIGYQHPWKLPDQTSGQP